MRQKVLRFGGFASILSGVFLIAFALLHPARDVAYATEPFWVWEHQLGVIAFTLMPFGLMGIYARQLEESEWLGLAGFGTSLAGTVLYMGGIFMDTYLFPTLAAENPDIVAGVLTAQISGPLLFGLGGASMLFVGGLMLFGFATYQADVLPRYAGVLLALGALVFGPGSAIPKTAQVLGAVILGVAFVWLGWAIWNPASEA